MVNEINKPNEPADNQQLGQRLEASGSALSEMQAEHHQLLAEMEQLRQRAEQLQSVRQQHGQVEQMRSEQYEESIEQTATSSISKSMAVQQVSSKSSTVQELSGTSAGEMLALTDEDDSEEAEYIRKKMLEIAQLKAQFKNVQNMINTTEMIEKHLSKHESVSETMQSESVKTASSSSSTSMKQQSIEVAQQSSSSVSKSVMEASSSSSKAIMQAVSSSSTVSVEEEIEQSVSTSSSGGTITAGVGGDDKEQLLVAMLDMFQDFNTDLKSQAENLKAERERIKALKENIIRSRQESKDEEPK